jgi:hypothetical protein
MYKALIALVFAVAIFAAGCGPNNTTAPATDTTQVSTTTAAPAAK